MDLPIWIYDCEVFKFDWIISFKNHETNEIITYHNNVSGLIDFYRNTIENRAVLIGYNNRHYDDWILLGLLNNCNLWLLNDHIITQHKNPWEYSGLRFKRNNIVSYDLMREIAIGEPISLKQLEGYLGLKIFENQIPFDLDRELTESELNEVIKYNIYDIDCTQHLFEKFKGKFISHLNLVEKYNIEPRKLGATAPQKTAIILNAQKPEYYTTFNFELPERLKPFFDSNDPVLNKFLENTYYSETKDMETLAFEHPMRDFNFSFGLGGGHGAIENFEYSGEIWNLDVKSYYVSLMIAYNLTPRSCYNGVSQLQNILEERIKLKDAGDKVSADALKMILVTIYGSMGFKNNNLFDPQMRVAVCVVGQLLLYLLQKRLEPYCQVIQVNTDGIMIIPYNKEKCQEIFTQWEKDTLMELELDIGERIIQKNVNNYIFVKSLDFDLNDKKAAEKYIKTKGSYLRFWNDQISNPNFYAIANFTINNNLTIIDEAIVKYFVYNTPVEETILNCQDLIRFQKIVKLMTGFTNITVNDNDDFRMVKVCDVLDDKENNNDYHGKSYRLFFVKNGFTYKRYKKLEDGSIKNDGIPDSSPNAVIYLDSVIDKQTPELDIDHDWYIRFAKRRINAFLNKEIFELEEL